MHPALKKKKIGAKTLIYGLKIIFEKNKSELIT
jgi:hypothetical protein